MGFISKGLKVGAYLAAVAAIFIGLVVFSSVPTKLGFYRWVASRSPQFVGLVPAYSYGVPWKFTFDELYALNLTGQTAVVTGANSGIGLAFTEALARLGADVTMACRSPSKCEAAAAVIQSNPLTTGKVRTMTVDTGSLASVQSFAKTYLAASHGKPLDMIFLNAGIMDPHSYKNDCIPVSADGIEHVFATNYLGHHLLYRWLEPALRKSSVGRVVSTSSNGSYQTPKYRVATDLETLNGCIFPDKLGLLSYGQTKLAQIVWTKYLTRRLGADSNIYVNAFNPGCAATPLYENTWGVAPVPAYLVDIIMWLKREAMWSPAEGALTGLYLGAAVDRLKQENVRGKYFHPQTQEVVNEFANNETLQDKLWEFSEQLVKDYLPLQLEES